MMRRPWLLAAWLSTVASFAYGQAAPTADHHQHLFSPGIATLLSDSIEAAVDVPRELVAVLDARAQANREPGVVADLYTATAVISRSNGPTWIKGRDAIVAWWASTQGRPTRLTPVAVNVAGSSAQVAAYVTAGSATEPRYLGQMLLTLVKETDGKWRIAAEAVLSPGPNLVAPITSAALVGLLDVAGIRRSLVLSVAYIYGSPAFTFADEYERVKQENDWTSQQVGQFPDRLRGFCSFNPLKDYAVRELERCANDPNLRAGIKLHFGSSGVDVHDPEHLRRVAAVFAAANAHAMAVVVHLRPAPRFHYGADEARVFLEQLLPSAPDVPVQIAHLAGSGPGWDDPPANEALQVFVNAVAAHDRRVANLYFDVATRIDLNISSGNAAAAAQQIRSLGVNRVLFGSDAATPPNLPPRQAWAAFRQLPLTEREFDIVAGNVAPYLR